MTEHLTMHTPERQSEFEICGVIICWNNIYVKKININIPET